MWHHRILLKNIIQNELSVYHTTNILSIFHMSHNYLMYCWHCTPQYRLSSGWTHVVLMCFRRTDIMDVGKIIRLAIQKFAAAIDSSQERLSHDQLFQASSTSTPSVIGIHFLFFSIVKCTVQATRIRYIHRYTYVQFLGWVICLSSTCHLHLVTPATGNGCLCATVYNKTNHCQIVHKKSWRRITVHVTSDGYYGMLWTLATRVKCRCFT